MKSGERAAFTSDEVAEIRRLLDGFPRARRAESRIAMARLRRMGLGIARDPEASLRRDDFEALLGSGALQIDEEAIGAVEPNPSGYVFRVAVGVTGHSVSEDWSAFDQRFQWFGRAPQSVASGAHLFVLAVDRWASAVVGLYEAVSSGAAKLPDSPDPERWPWALGVRPLAAIPPPAAERVEGQVGPQSGLPNRVEDAEARERLYRAVAASPPPPGPQTPEQRVQEVEWRDVVPDVLEAVSGLGKRARAAEVVARALELGEWSDEELAARAWYTGGGIDSHIEHVVTQVLRYELGQRGRLRQVHGVYSVAGEAPGVFAAPYRPAADGRPPVDEESSLNLIDLSELDRATGTHMALQDRLAASLRERGVEPRSPAPGQPVFDLAFEHGGRRFVVEVKGGAPVSSQQVRLGVGQVLEYRHLLAAGGAVEVEPVLLVESAPPHPWPSLLADVGVHLLRADRLPESLTALLGSRAARAEPRPGPG